MPDGDLVRSSATNGGGDRACQGGFKAAYADTDDEGARIAYQKWPNAGVPGELSQVLPSPQALRAGRPSWSPRRWSKEAFVCGNDPDAHLEMIDKYAEAGFDEVYVANTGPHYQGLFELYAKHVLPKHRAERLPVTSVGHMAAR